jgi:hypothetical protein
VQAARQLPDFDLVESDPRPRRRRRPSAGLVLFTVTLAFYLAVSVVLVFGANVILGDALARVANAFRILFSRDPHLAAIGFVWSPLQPLAILPLLPFREIWPDLTTLGFAGNIVTAVFMAGAVYQIWAFLRELALTRLLRIGLTAAFALHPLITFFGANGMSEAGEVFFLVVAVRYFCRWFKAPDAGSLVRTGLALAGAYFSRYEPMFGGFAAVALVALVSFKRTQGTSRHRTLAAACDAMLLGAPFGLAVLTWATTSYLITGQAFPQSTSQYGTTAQLAVQGAASAGGLRSLTEGIMGIVALEPFLGVVVALAAIYMLRSRDLRPLAVLSILFPVLTFMLYAYTQGAVLRSLRYFIVVVPLTVMLLGLVAAHERTGPFGLPARLRLRRPLLVSAVSLLALAGLTVSWPTSVSAMSNKAVNPGEAAAFGALAAQIDPAHATADQRKALHRFHTEQAMARYLDAMNLPDGSILTDDFSSFAIVLASRHPRQFVITADRDFNQILGDPEAYGVRYLLVPSSNRLGLLDALVRTYPGIYDNGAGLGTEVHAWLQQGDNGQDWKLYAVSGPGPTVVP